MKRIGVFDCVYSCARCSGTSFKTEPAYCMICRSWTDTVAVRNVSQIDALESQWDEEDAV